MKKNRRLKKQYQILQKIQSYKEQIRALTDQELSDMTRQFKERLSQGETLDELLPEAYAVICEADYRILGKFPYDVQILGGIALHQGYLIEMNTGEGKTIMATMPLYLNALTERSVILVTTNDYLAQRDAEEMGEVYQFMGLSVAAETVEEGSNKRSNEEKKQSYNSDIVYTTNSVLGFDYLINNLVKSAEERFMREFYYVILDEADSVLLDSAQTPMVISGAPRVQSNLYEIANFFVTTLIPEKEFCVEENKVWLTERGIHHAESFFGIDNFYGREHFEINRHVTLALRAHWLFEEGKDYVLSKEGEVLLLDNGTGRMLPGVKLRGCQHQAIETKERVEISQENRSMASVTLQNLFLMFPKMAGMSGTIFDATEELEDVYGKRVLVIPANRPVKRIDYPDKYYVDFDTQVQAAIDMALEVHKTGQPVLMVASTIAETEYISHMLVEHQVAHSVLNANNLYWEAEIIKEAGRKDAVTVATSIAGRGTDIKLGEGVRELGGLAVIGVGRMANVRQERQARGRAGRQGDPGFSQFFVSLEDDIVGAEDSPKLTKLIESGRHVSKRKLKRIINGSQRLGEEKAVISRKKAMDYDIVMKLQRKLMYDTRNHLLDGGDFSEEAFLKIVRTNIHYFFEKEEPTPQTLGRYILDNLSYRLEQNYLDNVSQLKDQQSMEDYLIEIVRHGLAEQQEKLGSPETMQDFMRRAALTAIDNAWVEQVDYLQQLQAAVSGRASAQRNVNFEYQKEALETFMEMERSIYREIVRNIMLSDVKIDKEGELRMVLP